jgi:hypothetical protein
MEILQQYINFILRPLPSHSTPTGYEVIDHFTQRTIFWTAYFVGWFFLFKYLGKYFLPDWYKKLSDRKRSEFPAYGSCLMHHIYAVPRGWSHIFQDFLRTEAQLSVLHYAHVESTIAPFSFGYLIGDTLCYGIPELYYNGNLDFMIHHVISGILTVTSLHTSGHLYRYVPHLLICDTTNIFFNVAWLLRTSEYFKGSTIVMILEILFAVFFLLTRVINLPLAIYSLFQTPYGLELGWVRYTLIPIVLLQFYWFFKIIAGITSRFNPSSKEGKAKSGESSKKLEKTD